jgi:hypothetical protein
VHARIRQRFEYRGAQPGEPQATSLNAGADSLSGGTTTTPTLDVVRPVRLQFGHRNTWLIVSRATRDERVHCMSMLHAGQIGGSSSSNARLILSTMTLPVCSVFLFFGWQEQYDRTLTRESPVCRTRSFAPSSPSYRRIRARTVHF